MDDKQRYQRGMEVRRKVLGDAHVDKTLEKLTPLNEEFQDFITRYAWGETWTRPGLDHHTRSMITIAMLIALNREAELKMHLRAAFNNGVTRDELKELIMHSALYCGPLMRHFGWSFDGGDEVWMTRPGYPAYRNTLRALGTSVVELACGAEVRYQPTVAMLEAERVARGAAPKGLVVASPANPTGTIIDADELAAIARWCDAHGVLLVSDEIYHGISFGRATSSAWQTSRQGAVIGSVSKFFSMTGWRVGWMLVPAGLREAVDVLLGNLSICAPANSQYAALGALHADPSLDVTVLDRAEFPRSPGVGVGLGPQQQRQEQQGDDNPVHGTEVVAQKGAEQQQEQPQQPGRQATPARPGLPRACRQDG